MNTGQIPTLFQAQGDNLFQSWGDLVSDKVAVTSWEIDGETVERVSDFIFLGSKITADGDCSQEIKRRLLLGRKL